MPGSPLMRVAILVVLAVVTPVAVLAVRSYREQRRLVDEITALRSDVYDARVSADACRNELAYEEMLFRRFNSVVDSLRADVRSYEEEERGGVPEAQYEEYLERFAGYNDSVASWEGRAEALRAMEQSCRDRVITHNALADSLRGRLLELAPATSRRHLSDARVRMRRALGTEGGE